MKKTETSADFQNSSENHNLLTIPVVCTDSTLQPEIRLISMSTMKIKNELIISLNKILEPAVPVYSKNLSRKFDKTADSSFSSNCKSLGVKKHKKK